MVGGGEDGGEGVCDFVGGRVVVGLGDGRGGCVFSLVSGGNGKRRCGVVMAGTFSRFCYGLGGLSERGMEPNRSFLRPASCEGVSE